MEEKVFRKVINTEERVLEPLCHGLWGSLIQRSKEGVNKRTYAGPSERLHRPIPFEYEQIVSKDKEGMADFRGQ